MRRFDVFGHDDANDDSRCQQPQIGHRRLGHVRRAESRTQVDHLAPGQALVGVGVLQRVEQRRLLRRRAVLHLRIARPRLHRLQPDAAGEQALPKRVVRRRHAEPVGALGQRLKRRRRRVHTVVAHIGCAPAQRGQNSQNSQRTTVGGLL